MTEPDLIEIHDFLISIAKKAGEMITSARPSISAVDTKKNWKFTPSLFVALPILILLAASDLVTETDEAVEKMVSSTLKSKYPDYSCALSKIYSHLLTTTVFWVKSPTNPVSA
jgi:myo-inositol-1(or 4)-monophosphatase